MCVSCEKCVIDQAVCVIGGDVCSKGICGCDMYAVKIHVCTVSVQFLARILFWHLLEKLFSSLKLCIADNTSRLNMMYFIIYLSKIA